MSKVSPETIRHELEHIRADCAGLLLCGCNPTAVAQNVRVSAFGPGFFKGWNQAAAIHVDWSGLGLATKVDSAVQCAGLLAPALVAGGQDAVDCLRASGDLDFFIDQADEGCIGDIVSARQFPGNVPLTLQVLLAVKTYDRVMGQRGIAHRHILTKAIERDFNVRLGNLVDVETMASITEQIQQQEAA